MIVPDMQRRHFEFIAQVLCDTFAKGGLTEVAHAIVANDFADQLQATNRQFDRARFLKACGVES